MRAISRDSTLARRKGIEVVTTTICPLPPRKQKGHAPLLSPACFIHKRQQIYRELFALPPSLGKIRAERQSLIYTLASKLSQLPFATSRTTKRKTRPPLSPSCFTNKHQQIYRELFMRMHQSYDNYHLHSPAKETERPRHHSPACFTHKHQQIYRKLLALPPSLEKIRVERQSLILCVGIKVVTTTNCPLTPMKQKDHAHHSHPHASLTSVHKSIESFFHYNPHCERYRRRGNP